MGNKIKLNGTTANQFSVGNITLDASNVTSTVTLPLPNSNPVPNTVMFVDGNASIIYGSGFEYTGTGEIIGNVQVNLSSIEGRGYAGTIPDLSLALGFQTVEEANAFLAQSMTSFVLNDFLSTGIKWGINDIYNRFDAGGGTYIQIQFNTATDMGPADSVAQYNWISYQSVIPSSYAVIPKNLSANVENVHIQGGAIGEVLSTDGAGNLYWNAGVPATSLNTTINDVNIMDNSMIQEYKGMITTLNGALAYADIGQVGSTGGIAASFIPGYTDDGSSITVLFNDQSTANIFASMIPAGTILLNDFPTETQYNYSGVTRFDDPFSPPWPYFDGTYWYITYQYTNKVNSGYISQPGDPAYVEIPALVTYTVIPTRLNADVGNVMIQGGSAGQVLSTDGAGLLSWVDQSGGGGGGNIDGNVYTTQGNTSGTGTVLHIVTDVNSYDFSHIQFDSQPNDGLGRGNITGEYVDMNASAAIRIKTNVMGIEGTDPVNTPMSGYLAGDWNFNQAASVDFVGNVNLGNIGNVKIMGGNAGQVLSTDGSNNLTWIDQSGGTPTSLNADISNVFIQGGNTNQVLKTDGAGNLTWSSTIEFATQSTYASFAGSAYNVNGSNISGEVANAVYANTSGSTEQANIANVAYSVNAANVVGTVANATHASTAGTVITAAQPNITSTGTLVSLTVSGNVSGGNISTSGLANLANVQLKIYEETVLSNANTGTSISPDVSTGSIFRYTANNNFSLNSLTNAVAGTSATIIITQDATGSRTLSSTMKFAGGSKTLSTAANSIDIICVFYDGTTYYATLSKGYA